MRFDVTDASPRTVGKPIEWSPPRMMGKEPDAATCATAFEIWSNVFSMFAGIVKTSPASHLCGAGRFGCAASENCAELRRECAENCAARAHSVICSRRSTPSS